MEELANHLAAVKLESAEKIHALTVEVTTLRGANASNQELLEHCNTYIGQLKAENSTKFRVEERNDWKSLCTSIQKDRQRLHEQVDELERERAALRGQLQGGAAERGAASSSSSSSTPPPAPTPVPGLSAAEAAAAPEPSAGGAAAAGAKTSASDTMAAAAEAAAAATEAPAAPVSATAGSSSSGAAAAGREAELLAAIEEMRRVERSLRFTVAQDRKRNIQLESDAKAHKRDVEAWRRECERLRVQAEGGSVFSSITRIFAAWRKQPPPARECPVNLV